jgi:hypothetical protein
MITVRSASVRNLASVGKFWIIQKETKPATIVAKPSNIKIQAQPCFPRVPFIFEIAAFWGIKSVEVLHEEGYTSLTASKAPKAPEIEAAEKKIAERIPNSERLYQLNNDWPKVYKNSNGAHHER